MSEPTNPPSPDEPEVTTVVAHGPDDHGRPSSGTTVTSPVEQRAWDPDDGDPYRASVAEAQAAAPDGDDVDVARSMPWWTRLYHRPSARAVVAGLLLAASMPPWGWWPLAFLGIAILDRLLAGTSWKQRLFRGSVAGWTLFTPTIFWMSQLTAPGYVIAVVFFGFLLGAFCIAVPPRAGRALGLIGVWMLCESLRSAWPFGGVPLSLLAVGQVGGPLWPIARIGGVLAMAGVTVAIGVAISAASTGQWRKAGALVVGALAVLGVAVVAPSGRPTGEEIEVAFVQGGGAQGTRAINTDRRKVFERHLAASEDVPDGMDLVLWPENVVDTDFDVQDAKEGQELQALARRLGAPLSVGTVEGVSDTRFRNSQQVLDADGTWGDRYVKVQRVPFGEWVPFRSLIEQVAPDTLAARDATVSHQSGLLRTDAAPLATAISWEVFFGHRARAAVEAGGEVIYNPTNGSTYTGTFVQSQQVASSRLRAIENGRWLVQVAPTGFSAFVTPEGRVEQRTATKERAVRHQAVPLRTGFTWYTRFGDTPARLAAVFLLAGAWALAWWQTRRRRTPEQPDVASAG
ncbi:apolipoprotein N-acyltransferase [Aquihabitans daechungensis]|uniref:apolipoprotein N-acyltransferase n=1 Tax=Aquihabitans daechungensis TaxID=1052257 RepID=UPI003BA3B75F